MGDAHDRFLVRLREIAQSVEILKHALDEVPSGEIHRGERIAIPAGESYSRVESSRGLLGCHVVSDGKTCPSRVQFRAASLAHLSVTPSLLVGSRIEDLSVILASLDLGIAEADR